MIEDFALTPVEWSATAFVALIVLMILFGRLKTKADFDAVTKEKDYWRETAITALKANDLNSQSISEMADGQRTTAKVIGAVQQQLPPPSEGEQR